MSEPYHSKSPPNKMGEELTLPRFIVIGNDNNKYLFRKDSYDETRGYLQFSGERMDSPHTKFEIEQASGENEIEEGLIHIRSCYNNKYWVCGQNQDWIIAEANEKEEDQTKRTCTLFRPFLIPFSSAFSLCHVHTNFMVRCWSRTSQQPPIPNALVTSDIESPYNDCLYAGTETPENRYTDNLNFEDWDSLSILPRHIAFKGDNGLYLSASMIDEHPYLKFNCENKNDQRVRNNVSNTGQGSIRIYSNAIKKFWKLSTNNWICPDSATNLDSPQGLFRVTRIDDNTISLCNLSNNHLAYNCQRYTADNKNDCLRAIVPDSSELDPVIPEEANLQVEELVINREIYNVHFHRVDYRRYDEKVLTIATATRTNLTSSPKRVTLEFTYRKENSQSWNASVTWKKDIETKLKVGNPYIDDIGDFRVSTEEVTTNNYQWGETIITQETDLKKTHEVEVPPMTKITVTLFATEEAHDVPYSYTQRDTLINGELVEDSEDDGLYTGICTYNYLCRTTKTESL